MNKINLLFLGVSSFTGYHFVNEISKNESITIDCTLTKNIKDYESTRLKRIRLISQKKNVKLISKIKFGNKKFINLLNKKKYNIICLHHAHTKNYNDDNKFNLKKSINENLPNIEGVFKNINKKALIVVSNTIFKDIAKKKYTAVNNYGISKTIAYEQIKKYCKRYNLRLKSIFIINPWGILEEKRLNYFLIYNWLKNKETFVSHPNYIRDNIYIDQLSKYYLKIINSNSKKIDYFPSSYCSTNKSYVEALKSKFEKVFNKKVIVKYAKKAKYSQPITRINGKKVAKKIKIRENLKEYFSYYSKII